MVKLINYCIKNNKIGAFELMSYRITENVILPFKIMPVINDYGKRIEARIRVKSIYDR